MLKQAPGLPGQDSLFGPDCGLAPDPALPPDFACREALVSPEQERELADRFERLAFKPFEFHGFLGKRHVFSFGWRYDFASRELRDCDPIPPFLLPLRRQAAEFAGVEAESLEQVLINKYAADAGIGWHRDRSIFQDVVAVSLLAPCVLRLRRKQGAGWKRFSHLVRPRSAYCLRGAVRWEWEHSIPPVEQLRYSVTFRNFVKHGRPQESG